MDRPDRIPPAAFPTTRWSRILGAVGTEREPDFEALAQGYWRPIYAYVRARFARSHDEALDATQDFFCWMLDSDFVGRADPARGRFRGYVKTALSHWIVDLERRKGTLKRGGGRAVLSLNASEDEATIDLPDDLARSPDRCLDEAWRAEVLERALHDLEVELARRGRPIVFRVFQDYFIDDTQALDYAAVAARYDVTTTDVSNYLMLAKRLFRDRIRAAVAETVSDPDALAEELDWILGA